jgi:hypothetical protein
VEAVVIIVAILESAVLTVLFLCCICLFDWLVGFYDYRFSREGRLEAMTMKIVQRFAL